MLSLNYLLLAVADPQRSAALYTEILNVGPVESSPTFVLYVLPTGLKLGLWIRHEMLPPTGNADGVDISFSAPDDAAVRRTAASWRALGMTILQEPTRMDFGFTCTAADPDGHRLRVFALAENPT